MLSPQQATERVAASVGARYRRERRFQMYGKLAIGSALVFLVLFMANILQKGIPGFFQHYVTLEVDLDRELLDPMGDASVDSLFAGNPRRVMQLAIYEATGAESRADQRAAFKLVSTGATNRLRDMILEDPSILGTRMSIQFAVDDDADSYLRGFITKATEERRRRVKDNQMDMIDRLQAEGRIEYKLSDYIFTGSDSVTPSSPASKVPSLVRY